MVAEVALKASIAWYEQPELLPQFWHLTPTPHRVQKQIDGRAVRVAVEHSGSQHCQTVKDNEHLLIVRKSSQPSFKAARQLSPIIALAFSRTAQASLESESPHPRQTRCTARKRRENRGHEVRRTPAMASVNVCNVPPLLGNPTQFPHETLRFRRPGNYRQHMVAVLYSAPKSIHRVCLIVVR